MSAINFVAVTSWSDKVPDLDVIFSVEAARLELDDFCKAWGLPVPGVQFFSRGVELPAKEAMIVSGVDSDGRPETLGYHTTVAGLPLFLWEVGAGPWVFLHELFETLVDPYVDRWVLAPDGSQWPPEVCDATQADNYPREVTFAGETRTITMPNWLRPEFFGLESFDGKTGCDRMGVCQPFTVRPGGYADTRLNGDPRRLGAEPLPKGCSGRVIGGGVIFTRSAMRAMGFVPHHTT